MVSKWVHTYKTSFAGLAKETWLLSGVMLVNRAGTMAIPFLSMYVTQALNRSLADAGLLITLFGIGSIAGAATGGWMVDKMGFRLVQIVSAVISGLLFLLIPSIHHFQGLCLLSVALSFFGEAFRPANFTAVAAYSKPENLTRSYTLNRLAINLGWASGAGLGGLVASYRYDLLFYIDGGTNILAGLLIWLLLPSSKKRDSHHRKEPAPAFILKPWQDAFFVRFFLLAVVFNTCFFLVFRLVPVFWKAEWHINEIYIGLILSLNGLIIALFEMLLVTRWSARNKPMMYIMAGCIANAAGYLFLLLPGIIPLTWALLAMLMMTAGEMLALPFMNSLTMQRTNQWNRGQYAAAYTLSWSLAQVLGPGAGAWVAQQGGYPLLWMLLLGLCLLAAGGFFWLNQNAGRFGHEGLAAAK
jgi:predicted MFS family arabinose efflux permease